jgi:hypothetical protein
MDQAPSWLGLSANAKALESNTKRAVFTDVFTAISSHLWTRCECRIAIINKIGTTFWSRAANETVHTGILSVTRKTLPIDALQG